jgi:CubicO group peptidase (beta-lactamase class C family)
MLIAALIVSACGTSRADVAVPIARPDATTSSGEPDEPLLTPREPAGTGVDTTTDQPADTVEADTDDVVVPATTQPAPTPTTVPATTVPATTVPATTVAPTTVPPTTLPPTVLPERVPDDPTYRATAAAFDRLARANPGTSLTVVRGGEVVFSNASGTTIDGQPATGDTPMVVASVSKIIVAMAIARLNEQGVIDVLGPMPWTDVGLAPNEAWNDVTIRELLDHESGLSKSRSSWFTGEGTCREYIPSLLTSPPNGDRGRWVYSNGNYCLLGLLVEQRTGQPLDVALQQLVFDPVGVDGVHLTYGGLQPGDQAHPDGVDRLSRLGGAGTLIVSTDDTALALGRMTFADRIILQPPAVFTDQYGFGHTGTVDGAKACIWVLEDGATVVAATIAGNSVSSGGAVCDIVVPAVASDLGFGSAKPERTP